MCNPAVNVVMFDNHLLFYKSARFKVIPGTMFSLTPFTEQERKGWSDCQVPGTVPNPVIPGEERVLPVWMSWVPLLWERGEEGDTGHQSAQPVTCWLGESHEPQFPNLQNGHSNSHHHPLFPPSPQDWLPGPGKGPTSLSVLSLRLISRP